MSESAGDICWVWWLEILESQNNDSQQTICVWWDPSHLDILTWFTSILRIKCTFTICVYLVWRGIKELQISRYISYEDNNRTKCNKRWWGKSVGYKNMKKLANIYRTLFYFKNFTHRNQQLSNKQQLSFCIFRNIHNIMSKIIIHTRYVWESLVFHYLQVFVTNETMENFTGFCCNRAFPFFLNSSSHKWVTPKTNQQKEVFMEQGIPEKWKEMCI